MNAALPEPSDQFSIHSWTGAAQRMPAQHVADVSGGKRGVF